MSLFDLFKTPEVNKPRGFEILRQKGIAKAVLTFSGGNDEGGVDEIRLIAVDEAWNQTVTQLDPHWGEYTEYVWDAEKQQHVEKPKPPKTPEDVLNEELAEILCAPVEVEFGSWCGDFSAYGTLTWDVAEGTVRMDKEVQSGYDSHSSDW